MRRNLFSSPINTLLTVLGLYLIYLIVPPLFNWTFWNADLAGDSREFCDSGGACWVFVKIRLTQFLYGFYPEAERWRPNLAIGLGLVALVYCLIDGVPWRKWVALFLLVLYPFVTYFLLSGGVFDMPLVETSKWGGLLLTIVIAVTGIVFSFPIGILLALGRRSNMPVVRMLCVRLHRVRARRAADFGAVHVTGYPAAVLAGGGHVRPTAAGADRGDVVLRGLHGRDRARRPAGDTARPVRSRRRHGAQLLKSMRLIVLPQALKVVIPALVSGSIGCSRTRRWC